MSRDDLFKINAGIVRDLVKGIAEYSPKAFILVISNPVNSTVPIAAEVMRQAGKFDPKRLFGVTTLDVVRAETFVQDITGEKDPSKTVIPVIGGHSGKTIVPLFSLAKPAVKIPAEELAPLIKRSSRDSWGGGVLLNIEQASSSGEMRSSRPKTAQDPQHSQWHTPVFGKNVHNSFFWRMIAKLFSPSFAEKVIKAAKGEKGIVEPTFVYLPGVTGGDAITKETGVDYFSVPVELGVRLARNFSPLILILTAFSLLEWRRPSMSSRT